VDAPDFGEHSAESQRETAAKKPHAHLAHEWEMCNGNRVSVHTQQDDAAQQQDDANQHNVVTSRLRQLNQSIIQVEYIISGSSLECFSSAAYF